MSVCALLCSYVRTYDCTYVCVYVSILPIPAYICTYLVIHLLADLLTTDVGTNGTACLIGVLQTLRNILPVLCNHADELSSSLPRNVYSLLLSCLTDTEDHNVVTSALEALQVLLQLVPTLQVRLFSLGLHAA